MPQIEFIRKLDMDIEEDIMDNKAITLYNEGYRYYSASDGYPLNYKKAYEYFKQSAALGVGDAINYLGCMYLDGKGVEKNIATAIEWFQKGVQAQNHWAMYNLGRLYNIGQGVAKNEHLALELFKKSYSVGKNPKSAYFVGCDLMNRREFLEAGKLFQLCANKTNMPEAWHNLGVLFFNGSIKRNGESRYQSAYSCFVKAADQGFAQSMYECGRTLEIASRGTQSHEAKRWYQRAADAGYAPAKRLLMMLDVGEYGIVGGILGN